MKFLPVDYRIDCLLGPRDVRGYAFQAPAPFDRLHFCVRRDGREWVIDHFESGLGVSGPVVSVTARDRTALTYVEKWRADRRSRSKAVAWLLRYLPEARRVARVHEGFERNGFGWLLAEAGL